MSRPEPTRPEASAEAPFLPLAFRFAASFGLMALHLALPPDSPAAAPGEGLYLALLAGFFLESAWEAWRSGPNPFGNPSPGWIRANLFLDALLVSLVLAFHGVDQERLGTLYIFPVLASAFYLRTTEILAVGLLSSACHIVTVTLFTSGLLPPFGASGGTSNLEPFQHAFILGFATLQILASTLIVLLIREHLEHLRSDLSRTEAAVDELAALYRRVFESMFSGLITTDLDGRITSANPAAEKILHAPLSPGMAAGPLGFGDLDSHRQEQRFELTFTSPEGMRRIVGGNVAPLRGTVGEPTGHLLVFQDLTEIKQLEERTRVHERLAAVGELSAELAHELRNPMASILGCAQILRQGGQTPALHDRALTILQRESERVSAIVTDFLDFTRPRPARLQPLALRAVVEEVRASWETDARNAGLALEMDPPPDLAILGDPIWVHQIMTNLMSNARKALRDRPGPRIRLAFRAGPERLDLVLTDNGCGMDPDRLASIFIPFASGFEEGTGLGMSLVYQFATQMGWEVQVDSTLDAGTEVTLAIPLAGPET